ncbi:MAG: dienelactone hydrolase family protein [Gemmatimonadaceae bacterium]
MQATRYSSVAVAVIASAAIWGCVRAPAPDSAEHADHAQPAAAGAGAGIGGGVAIAKSLPAADAEAAARIAASPRHAEWVTVPTDAGSAGGAPGESIRAWVVYPERKDKAPVVVVIHEIFGLSPWIRAVADQLAADGFIAIAPDLLSNMNIPGSPENPNPDTARAAIRNLQTADVQRQLSAVARYGMALPAALPRYGIVGFCWGGARSFQHAVHAPGLGASVVYYGTSPSSSELVAVQAPVLGLYGENDARVNATIPPADSTMRALGKTYEKEIYAGAGHGFLRAQDAQNGANLEATRRAWPRTIAWFRKYLGEQG